MIVGPYEQTLNEASAADRERWAVSVHAQLRAAPEYQQARTVVWLAGDTYRAKLLPLVERDGKHCEIPMFGLTQGEQLSWLDAQLADAGARFLIKPAGRHMSTAVRGTEGAVSRGGRGGAPSAADFRIALERLLSAARSEGKGELTVTAGELHRILGGYPGPQHRMPICSRVMRSEMRLGDAIVASPPKGAGASLAISYRTARG
jgi:5-methylcytosine-specific restriction protein A